MTSKKIIKSFGLSQEVINEWRRATVYPTSSRNITYDRWSCVCVWRCFVDIYRLIAGKCLMCGLSSKVLNAKISHICIIVITTLATDFPVTWASALVHQFTKTLQLLGTPYRGFAPGPFWGTSVPQTPYLLPPTPTPWRRQWRTLNIIVSYRMVTRHALLSTFKLY